MFFRFDLHPRGDATRTGMPAPLCYGVLRKIARAQVQSPCGLFLPISFGCAILLFITKEIDMVLPVAIESSAKRLFPNLQPEQAIAELLLERAQKNLIKYQTAAREFETRYAQTFETFRKMILSSKPDSVTEQDYFDWELTATGIADMQNEIQRLEEINSDLWDEQIERDARSGKLDKLADEAICEISRKPKFGSAKGKIKFAKDSNEPMTTF